jgi:hypothetical protein
MPDKPRICSVYLAFLLLANRGGAELKVIKGKLVAEKEEIERLAIALLGEMEIFEIFHILRRRAEISQVDIGKQTNISSGFISMFERGSILLPDEDIEKLLKKIKEIKESEEISND